MANWDFESGEVLLIDKPFEWTSFDVVKKIRNAIKIKKVGHAGTLDPLATGLLIICTGKKTKQIDTFMALEKEYEGVLLLGRTTPSVDLETGFNSETDIAHIKPEDLFGLLPQFTGEIEQVPPVYSAIKVDGERVYNKARIGETIDLKSRKVNISEFSITKIILPEVHFKVACSKGTYIRSLVRDFGEALGVGAVMTALRRTRIGDFSVNDAYSLNDLISQVKLLPK